MTAQTNTLSMALVAASANGLATSQSLASAGNLTLNGSLVSSSVGTFDVARRVGITSVGNDSGLTWTITGTDRKGRAQSENLTGANAGTAQSVKDYKTVTQVYGSGATAGNVTAGSTSVASSEPIVVNYLADPFSMNASLKFSGTATASIEVSNDDLAPNYDVTNNPPSYFTAQNFSSVTGNTMGPIAGPINLIRLTILAGTGTVTAQILQGFGSV